MSGLSALLGAIRPKNPDPQKLVFIGETWASTNMPPKVIRSAAAACPHRILTEVAIGVGQLKAASTAHFDPLVVGVSDLRRAGPDSIEDRDHFFPVGFVGAPGLIS